ncbi:MAG: DUF493 family protein [Candidatus Cloacimonetes bacterium]|nr:DUF493 family protein [Candidatus Cloacimonadota bacterium]
MSHDSQSFIDILNKQYEFPTKFKFKFIVPKDQIDNFKDVFSQDKLSSKVSKKGNFTSFTIEKKVPSAQSIVEVYAMVSDLKGVISL